MIAALIIFMALVVVGGVLYIHHRLTYKPDPATVADVDTSSDQSDGCCGMHVVCERDSLLSTVSDSIVYYDDEELDVFRGREADDYTDEEIEQFRDVLLTLLPTDIAGWGRSVQQRGITLPSAVRDELIMIVSEARQASLIRTGDA